MFQRTLQRRCVLASKQVQRLFFSEASDACLAQGSDTRAALAYIHEGDTIIIDAGSTNIALAEVLPVGFGLYVIAGSVPAALELSRAGYESYWWEGPEHSLALIGQTAIKTLERPR